MGEVAMNNEGGEMEVQETGVGVVKWEKFMPRMVMRVLLVEADDSTRQIITALLRKCSYKVAAVADGLKAWEILKGRPHNIDLILTEVELPSISGFALLTLIAEHEVCKNIPIIMMSAHDSVSTVYKCMLRGAADFLVKPVRKNELKNLWQHVWRKQTSNSEGPEATSVAQQKVEATAENNATSNHSSGYEACVQRNRECIEKGSDAQSSCTKPDSEAEGAHLEHRQDLSQKEQNKSLSSDIKRQCVEQSIKGSEQMLILESEAHGSAAIPNTNALNTTSRDNTAAHSHSEFANVSSEAFDNNNVHVKSSREAIDLIGAFDKYTKCSYKSIGSTYSTNKVDSSSLLDLTLRRSHPSSSVNQDMDNGPRLKQSDASAFSRYVSRTIHPLNSTSASICNQQKGYETNSDKQISHQGHDNNSDTQGPEVIHDNNMISLTTAQPGQVEIPYPNQRAIPVTVPVRGARLDNVSTAYGSILPPMYCTQPSHPPLPSPDSSGHQDPKLQLNQLYPISPEIRSETRSSPQLHYVMDQNIHNASSDQKDLNIQGHKVHQDRGHFSSATDQSGSSSFCNGSLRRFNSFNSANNGETNAVPLVKVSAAPDSGNESSLHQEGNCQRSMLREAALTKFRMKRKDRCYEKKVRYESRKKLAEQRPRVKGQFVRQVYTGALSLETDNQFVSS